MGRLPAIDSLRGVAILMVTGFHLWRVLGQPPLPLGLTPFAPWGANYVSLFFCLSGFCLTLGKRLPAVSFYRRRLVRLLPPYWLAVVMWLPLWAIAPHNPRGWAGWPYDLLTHLTLTHTFFPAYVYSVNGVFWFVGTLTHLYLLYPGLSRLADRWPAATTTAAVLGTTLFRWWAVSALPYSVQQGVCSPQQLALVSAPAHLAEFVCGMVAAQMLATPRPLIAAILAVPAVAVGPVVHSAVIPPAQALPYWWADSLLAPSWAALIVSGAWSRWAAWSPLVHLGRISYGVFLHNYAMYWLPLWAVAPVLLVAGHITAWLQQPSQPRA